MGMDDAGAGRRGRKPAGRRAACCCRGKAGLKSIPVTVARGWSEEEKRAYRLADNQLAARASWDLDLLRSELQELGSANFDLPLIGFEPERLDDILNGLGASGLPHPASVP